MVESHSVLRQCNTCPSAPVTVRADPTSLKPGTYFGIVSILASGATAAEQVRITMRISALPQPTLLLSQTALTFTGTLGGGAIPSQNIGVLNTGRGTLNWTASTVLAAGVPNWLIVQPASGVSDASAPPPILDVHVNPAGLSPGIYYGQIKVSSSNASNSTQFATIILQLLAANATPDPVVLPTGLIFFGTDPQNVVITNTRTTAVGFTSRSASDDQVVWFSATPSVR